jgi:hypothetical protein
MTEAAKKEPPRYEPQSSIWGALVRNLMTLFFVGIAVMGVYNVFGVGGEIEVMAKENACQGQPLPCPVQFTSQTRTPWAHTFKIHNPPASGATEMYCQRQYIFAGDYSCKPIGGSTARNEASSAPSSTVSVRFPPKTKIPAPARPLPAASSASSAPSTSAAPIAPTAPAANP